MVTGYSRKSVKDVMRPEQNWAMDGAPGDGEWVMEEQATANATAGPSTAWLTKCREPLRSG